MVDYFVDDIVCADMAAVVDDLATDDFGNHYFVRPLLLLSGRAVSLIMI
ncbi:hypothetical protein ACFQHW_05640 [Lapidilactobacillus achengensis]|uniref:Uncharacterized protein n=1 Tax=Lapidilactobacillus achengensis TaxID=2486000 RepID=A0ABW1UNZ2_9LACO|nr:hypothetical protein [Lapidilactobacillus achengensis]